MDKMDRMLRALPQEQPSPELARRIQRSVLQRHRRRQAARLTSASLLALLGLWLTWPGILWLSSGVLSASGTAWLLGSLDYLGSESIDMATRFLNGTLSAPDVVGSSFALSVWLGALLLCCAIFLAIDPRAWQPVPGRGSHGGSSTMLASSVHI